MRTAIHYFICLLTLGAAFLVIPMTASADQNNSIKVHLIVFTQQNQSISEDGLLITPKLKKDVIELSTDNTHPIYKMNDSRIGMNFFIHRLKQQGKTILINTAWVQPESQDSPWVHVFGGFAYDASGHPLSTPPNTTMTANPDAAYWQLNGTVRVRLDGKFIINTNLLYTMTDSHSDAPVPLVSSRMEQVMQTPFNQIVYFDHPNFGVVIKITRGQVSK